MNPAREPTLNPVAIEDLRPTQITVGMREVEAKRAAWRAKAGDFQNIRSIWYRRESLTRKQNTTFGEIGCVACRLTSATWREERTSDKK